MKYIRENVGKELLGVLLVICLLPVTLADGIYNESPWLGLFNQAYCYMSECCGPDYVNVETAVKKLSLKLPKIFFGQHLALETTLRALDGHLKDPNPGKPLVLSFHGWAGSGKTFLAEQIIKTLYAEGLESKYVKFFQASYHFPDPSNFREYQYYIRRELRAKVGGCEFATFVFDEVDKTPPKVLDAVTGFIDAPGLLNGLNYKRSIFILLSNSGSTDITTITHEAWKKGKKRDELTFSDFEEYISKEVFNHKESGLFKSNLIDRSLVDFYIPFLPMQRHHVISCIKAEIKRHGLSTDPEEIADLLVYWPSDTKLYSQSGCKRIESLVKYKLSEYTFRDEL